MAVLLTNSFEGGTNGAAPSAGNSGGVSGTAISGISVGTGNAITYSNERPANGSLGVKVVAGGSVTGFLQWTFGTPPTTRIVARFYVEFDDVPTSSANGWLMFTYRDTGGSNGNAGMGVTRDGKFYCTSNGGATVAASIAAGAISADTRYRVEWAVTRGSTTTNGRLEYRIYLGNSTTILWQYDSGTTLNTGALDPAYPRLGISSTGMTGTAFYDELSIQDLATGWIGPVAASAPSIGDGGSAVLYNIRKTSSADVTWTITQTSGVATTPSLISSTTTSVHWTVTQGTAAKVYTVTATPIGGGTATTTTVTVPAQAVGEPAGHLEILVKGTDF